MTELRWAMVAFRVAMGVTFLSPVADRFGLWSPLDYSVFVDAAGSWLLAAVISCDRRMAAAELARPAAAGTRTT